MDEYIEIRKRLFKKRNFKFFDFELWAKSVLELVIRRIQFLLILIHWIILPFS